jgi:hypothetical protein
VPIVLHFTFTLFLSQSWHHLIKVSNFQVHFDPPGLFTWVIWELMISDELFALRFLYVWSSDFWSLASPGSLFDSIWPLRLIAYYLLWCFHIGLIAPLNVVIYRQRAACTLWLKRRLPQLRQCSSWWRLWIEN